MRRWLRICVYNKGMSDFAIYCVWVIEGIWGGCKFLVQFLVPVLIVSVCGHVVELSNRVYGLKNAVNALEEELSDQVHELKNAVNALEEDLKDSDDEGYTTEEN